MCCLGLQLYRGGIRNLNLTFVLKEVAWPVIVFLSLCILVPYIILMGVPHPKLVSCISLVQRMHTCMLCQIVLTCMLFVCTVRVHVQYPMSFEHICHMLIQTLRKWFLLLYQCTSDNINSLNAKCIYIHTCLQNKNYLPHHS